MTSLSTTPPAKGLERVARPGLMAFMLLAVVFSAVALVFAPGEFGRRAVSFTIAGFAIFGVFSILMYVFDLVRFVGRASEFDLARAIPETSEDGLVVTSSAARALYANEAYRALSGGVGEVRGVERLFAGAPETAEAIYRLAQAARSGQTRAEELRVSPPLSGQREAAWYRIRVRPLANPGEQTALWTITDITSERDRHETFFQDLQHAIDYLDHAPAGFFSAEADGAIAYMNATLANWLDYDIAEFTPGQMTLSDIVAADGAALLDVSGGAPGEVKQVDVVVDLKRRQGVSKPARLIHRVTFNPDGRAAPSRTLVLETAAETPREGGGGEAAEARFSRMFNTTPLPLALVAPDGTVRRANGAFAKLAPAAAKGGRASLYTAVVDHAALKASIAAAAEGRAEIAPVDAAVVEGKNERPVRFFISPAGPGEDGAAVNVIALDMTEQKTLQESFAQSQKMQAIGQLAGGVAHDFNNVLTAIIGYSDLLLVNHRPTDPSFQDIMQIRQNANRAAGLVRQLLAFSRRQTLRPQVLQLADVLSELQMMLRRLVGEKIELEVSHGRDLWLVKADLNQFEQVVVNLVVNARDAMTEGGRITLRTRNVGPEDCAGFNEKSLVPADYVLVEVQDTGTGIPPEVRDKIFEPFFTTKEVGKGTGLGLSMVYGIVKQTGGYVFCVSEPGQGATFRILLPRHIAEPVVEVAKKAEAKPAADLTGKGAILLVEDEEAVRAFASRALASRGYTVLEADSGVDALRVVEEANGEIDLIVSDVIMPEMDGPTMLMELRGRGITAKVVFVSGYADDAFSRSLPEGQEFQFLPKPFTLKQLIETVKATMG